ncbi:MAG: DUF1189 domain-containing protein [Candidatus Margulisbacteria bacterium]|nr:DUF1189 domain-containing protein [Candidatus Margulisiibacteriota bacterium]
MKGFFKRVLSSCFDMGSYLDIVEQPFSATLGYLTLLVLLASLLFSIMVGPAAIQAINELGPWVRKNIPEIHLKDGKISSPVKQPHTMSTGSFYAVIDTTGRITNIPDDAKNGILLGGDRVTTKNSNEIKTYLLKDFPDFSINSSMLASFFSVLKWLAFPCIFLLTFLISWLAKMFQIIVFSLLALAFEALAKKKLGFTRILNLAGHALTLPILLSLFVTLFNIAIPQIFYYYLVFIFIFVWTVNLCRAQKGHG